MNIPVAEFAELQLSDTSPLPTTFHGWSVLPDELKTKILAHNIVHADTINDKTHELQLEFVAKNPNQPDSKNADDYVEVYSGELDRIIGTHNKAFVSLALQTYYEQNVFQVKIISRYPAHVIRPP
jgi:hypothetical protein